MKSMGIDYITTEWRLFIDSSSRRLKAVLLHNGNEYSSIPIGHSVQMKDTHDSMDQLLSALNYHGHGWLTCGDLKVVGLVYNYRWVHEVPMLSVFVEVGLMTNIMSDKNGH